MDPAPASTPFLLVSQQEPVRSARKREVLDRTRSVEQEALRADGTTFAVACLQDVRFFTPYTRMLYEELARGGAQVLLFARGMHATPAEGVRGVDLPDDHPLGDEWVVLVHGSTSRCVAAQDVMGDEDVDPLRAFAWSETVDPQVVEQVLAQLRAYAGEDASAP